MARPRIGSILVATDLGEGSEAVVAAAGSLAARTGAELHTVHSLQLPVIPSEDIVRRTGFSRDIEDAEERLHQQGREVLTGRVTPASEVVIIYLAYRAILDRAIEVSADLIILGPHRGIGASRYLGTTADRVARLAQVSCLLVPEPTRFPVSRLGVATDFSPAAREALDQGMAWAEELAGSPTRQSGERIQLHVLHVAHPMLLAGEPDLTDVIPREMSGQIEAALGAPRPPVVADVHSEILWHDNPSEALVEWVSRQQIGLLILGTHGRGVLKRALIGSVASSMARLTPCPLLLVPPPPSIVSIEN